MSNPTPIHRFSPIDNGRAHKLLDLNEDFADDDIPVLLDRLSAIELQILAKKRREAACQNAVENLTCSRRKKYWLSGITKLKPAKRAAKHALEPA